MNAGTFCSGVLEIKTSTSIRRRDFVCRIFFDVLIGSFFKIVKIYGHSSRSYASTRQDSRDGV